MLCLRCLFLFIAVDQPYAIFIHINDYIFILGSIKIWDFGAGQCIKEKKGRQSDEDLSITGLVYSKLEDDRVIIASGWNNKIRILLVSKCQRSQH